MRKAFTLLELVFVIVIVGIVGNIGADIFKSTYTSLITSEIDNKIQTHTNLVSKQIASLLEHRIKETVIVSTSATDVNFKALNDATADINASVLEWISIDHDGWRGRWNGTYNQPIWSGLIDVDDPAGWNVTPRNILVSPETNTTLLNQHIQSLSVGGSTINNAAIFFIGANSNINSFGWHNGGDISGLIAINSNGVENQFQAAVGNFIGRDIYEYYRLSWTAHALVRSSNGDLTLFSDYQPWEGENYNSAGSQSSLMVENVETLKFQSVGDIIKFQICISDDNLFFDGGYSYCKEKAVF